MGYLKAEAEIRPKGDFFVVDTEYVGHNGSDLKSIISAIQTADYNALSNIPTINGVSLKGNLSAQNLGLANAVDIPTPMVSYGTCTTAAAKAAKVVTLVNADGWTLKTGCMIMVKSSYTNTAQNPTLNVNGSGAKTIIYGSTPITTTYLSYAAESTKQSVFFYNGTSWVWIAHGTDNNTTYSSKDAASEGTATSLCTTGEKYIWNNKYDKPSDGIPKTDLASNVQTSLGKADTALQTHQSYADISDKPSINGITLTGNLDASDLSLASANVTDVFFAENLIPCPYSSASGYTASGLTYTYDDYGTITINGTAEISTNSFALWSNNKGLIGNIVPGESYTLTVSTTAPIWFGYRLYNSSTQAVKSICNRLLNVGDTVINFVMPDRYDEEGNEVYSKSAVFIRRGTEGDVHTNTIVKVQIEVGNESHRIQPYVLSREGLYNLIKQGG